MPEPIEPTEPTVPAPDANAEKLARLVADKRAAGLPKEDAEQIARKQIEHDAKIAAIQETQTTEGLAQLRSELELLTLNAQRLGTKLTLLEQQSVAKAAPPFAPAGPALN